MILLKLIRSLPYVRDLEKENIRLRKELDFERGVSGNQQKFIGHLTDHRDLLLSSLDQANRELTRLRSRGKAPRGENKGGTS